MPFLHGVEVVEVDTGSRQITVAATSVIGVVGTAIYADADAFPLNTPVLIAGSDAQAAKLSSELGDDETPNSADECTLATAVAKILQQTGALIVAVRVERATMDTPAELLSAEGPFALVDGQTLVLDVDGGGDDTATFNTADFSDIASASAAEVAAVINTDIDGVVADVVGLRVRVRTDSTGEAATLQRTGGTATALGFSSAEVSGSADVYDEETTIANVVGGVTGAGQREGISALTAAQGTLGQKPKILIATGYSDQASVQTALKTVAAKLGAMAVFDGPNTTDAAAISAAGDHDSRYAILCDPHVRSVAPSFMGTPDTDGPMSAFVAGVMAKTDNELGWWHSPSNKSVNGIIGTVRPVDFALGDATASANLLNEANVMTIIREGGWRLWGNRTLSADPKWTFIPVVRTALIINDAILASHMWAVDRGITKTYLEDVVEGVQSFLDDLKRRGAIIGGRCWANPDLNTPETIAGGQVYIDFDFTPVYPAERVTFRSLMTNGYLIELLAA